MSALSKEDSEHSAYEEKIAELRPDIRGYLLSLTGSLAAAEDLTQETSLTLWAKRWDYDPEKSFRAWAFRIAFFKAKNHRRKESRRIGLELPLDETFERIGESAANLPSARSERLEVCLGRMSVDHRELLLRRYQDGVSLEMLSQEEASNRNALAQKIFRLKRSLLECLTKGKSA